MTFKIFCYHILILKNRHHTTVGKSCQIRKSGNFLVLTDERGKQLNVQIDLIVSDLNKVPTATVSCFVDLNHLHEEPYPIHDYFAEVPKPNLKPIL